MPKTPDVARRVSTLSCHWRPMGRAKAQVFLANMPTRKIHLSTERHCYDLAWPFSKRAAINTAGQSPWVRWELDAIRRALCRGCSVAAGCASYYRAVDRRSNMLSQTLSTYGKTLMFSGHTLRRCQSCRKLLRWVVISVYVAVYPYLSVGECSQTSANMMRVNIIFGKR
jgi:hypothetical protein